MRRGKGLKVCLLIRIKFGGGRGEGGCTGDVWGIKGGYDVRHQINIGSAIGKKEEGARVDLNSA